MKASFQYVAHGGRLVFVGHTKLEVSYNNPLFHSREMTVMGSRNARAEDFTKCIDCIQCVEPRPRPGSSVPPCTASKCTCTGACCPASLADVVSGRYCRRTGKVNPLPWITHKGPLSSFTDRDGKLEEGDFMRWMQPEAGVIKAVVLMED
jgi:hypothetical protein